MREALLDVEEIDLELVLAPRPRKPGHRSVGPPRLARQLREVEQRHRGHRILVHRVDLVRLDDVSAAIDKLAELDRVDLSRVVTIGHSAGGHLAAWAATREYPRVPLTGVVSQAGVLDLGSAYDDDLGAGAVVNVLGHRPGPTDAPLDPLRQVPLDVPVHCVHGTLDDNVPLSQSQAYVAAARAAGATAELTTIEGIRR